MSKRPAIKMKKCGGRPESRYEVLVGPMQGSGERIWGTLFYSPISTTQVQGVRDRFGLFSNRGYMSMEEMPIWMPYEMPSLFTTSKRQTYKASRKLEDNIFHPICWLGGEWKHCQKIRRGDLRMGVNEWKLLMKQRISTGVLLAFRKPSELAEHLDMLIEWEKMTKEAMKKDKQADKMIYEEMLNQPPQPENRENDNA